MARTEIRQIGIAILTGMSWKPENRMKKKDLKVKQEIAESFVAPLEQH
jgi:hypothetical protein